MTLKHILLTVLCTTVLGLQAQERNFTRNKVLVEKHTGINCTNCPSGDNAYSGYIARHPDYAGKIVMLRHNSYLPKDNLFIPFQRTLSETWSISGWPKYLVDRSSTSGVQTSAADCQVNWGEWNDTDKDFVGRRLEMPTYVSLALDGTAYDPATRKLTVMARGEVTKPLPNLAINVFLKQNNINGSSAMDYNNSTRACLTENLNGEKLSVVDGWYEYYKEYTIEEIYERVSAVPADMDLVVFVSTFNLDGTNDFSYSEVHNADEVRLADLPTTAPARCATPAIRLEDGKLNFSSTTEGATFSYTLAPVENITAGGNVACKDVAFKVTAVAMAENHTPSKVGTAVFTLEDVKASCAPKESPVVFVNPCDGMEYGDGETMIITPEIDPQWGDVLFPAPILRNKGTEDVSASLHYTLDMPHGSFSECVSVNCYDRQVSGDYTSDSFTVPAGKDLSSLCEWNCMTLDTYEPKAGTCIAQFTLYVGDEAASTVTVKYVYDTRPIMTHKMGAAGYGTLYADRALKVPTGLTAYTVSEDDGRLTTTAITDGVIPARTGAILEGAAKVYIFYTAPSYGTAPRGCLKGVLADTPNPGGTYVLSVVDDCLGFYRYAEGAVLKANRAYYQPTVANASAFLLDFLGQGPTDISLTKSPIEGDMEGLYDLSGRKASFSSNAKSLYIVGGKKIIR